MYSQGCGGSSPFFGTKVFSKSLRKNEFETTGTAFLAVFLAFFKDRLVAGDAQGTTAFDFTDQLGSTRLITAVNQSIVDNMDYEPFGQQAAGGSATTHKFTGKQRDAEDGLDYFGARYYSSSMGRFMSPDWSSRPEGVPYAQLDNPQSLNLYGYVGNDPVDRVDPDGHMMTLAEERASWGDESGADAVTAFMMAATDADIAATVAQAQSQSVQTTTPITVKVTPKRSIWSRMGSWFSSRGSAIAVAFARWGRLGGPAHRAAIDRISKTLEEDGYKVTREKYIPTPNGAKGYRFADVYAKNKTTGEVRMYQVGRSNANGTPVSREVQAMDDIQDATGIRPQFIDYNSPLVTGIYDQVTPGDSPINTEGGGDTDIPFDVP